ncbi:hypothetical protein NNO_0709 [Hydrogenimonas sp.]|nr:hypothetical protein NNO_0709 [Hydrogenimonas sp.]
MLKSLLSPLAERGYIFKKFEPFSPKKVGSRKRISIFHGLDVQNRYLLLFHIKRRSRVSVKDAKEWLELKSMIENYYGHSILINIALVEAPVCSKAKALLESEGWEVLSV